MSHPARFAAIAHPTLHQQSSVQITLGPMENLDVSQGTTAAYMQCPHTTKRTFSFPATPFRSGRPNWRLEHLTPTSYILVYELETSNPIHNVRKQAVRKLTKCSSKFACTPFFLLKGLEGEQWSQTRRTTCSEILHEMRPLEAPPGEQHAQLAWGFQRVLGAGHLNCHSRVSGCVDRSFDLSVEARVQNLCENAASATGRCVTR
jgi:hypothetical protein